MTGSLQPGTFLIAATVLDGEVTHVSANICEQLSGAPNLPRFAQDYLGTDVTQWVAELWSQALLATRELRVNVEVPIPGDSAIDSRRWDCRAFRAGDICALEFIERPAGSYGAQLVQLERMLSRLRQQHSLESLLELAVSAFRELVHFDRVLLFRFAPDWSSEVICESVEESLQQEYLGRRLPQEDIPEAQRALNQRNRVRIVSEVRGQEVSILSGDGHPRLDLSHSLLRALPVQHRDYFEGLGVQSSLSVAITHGDRLWGMMIGHNYSPLHSKGLSIGFISAASRIYADVLESQLHLILERQDEARRVDMDAALAVALSAARRVGFVQSSLHSWLCEMTTITGLHSVGVLDPHLRAAVINGESVAHDHAIFSLVDALFDCHYTATRSNAMMQTSITTPGFLAAAPPSLRSFCGMAIVRSEVRPELLVFAGLEESPGSISWAGRGSESVVDEANGRWVVRPRSSFSSWQETVVGHSRDWTDFDLSTLRQFSTQIREWLAERDRSASHRLLNSILYVDDLTGLRNRNFLDGYFSGNLPQEWRQVREGGGAGCVVLFDVADFKSLNRKFGRLWCDACLCALANAMEAVFRNARVIARIDSDDFAVIVEDRTSSPEELAADTTARAHLLTERLQQLPVQGAPHALRAVFGIATYAVDSSTFSSVIAAADSALRDAKARGRALAAGA